MAAAMPSTTEVAGHPRLQNNNNNSNNNKRKASAAGLSGAARQIKRRASKACCCCRARKVRCDVVENGSPCTNCRLDEVECVVTESRRRKKPRQDGESSSKGASASSPDGSESGTLNAPSKKQKQEPSNLQSPNFPDPFGPVSPPQPCADMDNGRHVPHLIYQTQGQRADVQERQRRMSSNAGMSASAGMGVCPPHLLFSGMNQLGSSPPAYMAKGVLPDYIRPLPAKFQDDDIDFLHAKGALTVPDVDLRNELLKSYVQYVHNYMPLLDLDEFLGIVLRNDASQRLSLLLFQAVMFAGTAFIDFKHLRATGFETRKAARKAFFQRARLLYDFDYEVDRISLVQSLLLMTHWYEMPDDQKDTWHWMGVSLSLSHTIGLHRNPANSNMDSRRQKLWKRIWWSTYTRDRLIALGMRRPTRIKDEDCDVPMLTINDFEIKPFSPEVVQVLGDCEMVRNVSQQKELAIMFVEKAKLCLCISQVLSAQYSVLSHKFGGTTETTMMLVPKKSASETCDVRKCDDNLEAWLNALPVAAKYRTRSSTSLGHGEEVLHLHRALLKMIYLTTSSALHRPQVLPAVPIPTVEPELQTLSRTKVRHAAVEITSIAQDLHTLDLTRYLPTTGVTVLLPAVIIHLLDIKSSDISIRNSSLHRFYQCMQILQRLREMYASADYATSFLEAAIRKAGIQVSINTAEQAAPGTTTSTTTPNSGPAARKMSTGLRKSSAVNGTTDRLNTLTPPPETLPENISGSTFAKPTVSSSNFPTPFPFTRSEEQDLLFASTPPQSVGSENGSTQNMQHAADDPEANILANKDKLTGNNPNPGNDNSGGGGTSGETTLSEFMNLAHDADITQHDLDALINFDDSGAVDLFGGNTNTNAGLDDGGLDELTLESMAAGFAGGDGKVQFDLNWMREFEGDGDDNDDDDDQEQSNGQGMGIGSSPFAIDSGAVDLSIGMPQS